MRPLSNQTMSVPFGMPVTVTRDPSRPWCELRPLVPILRRGISNLLSAPIGIVTPPGFGSSYPNLAVYVLGPASTQVTKMLTALGEGTGVVPHDVGNVSLAVAVRVWSVVTSQTRSAPFGMSLTVTGEASRPASNAIGCLRPWGSGLNRFAGPHRDRHRGGAPVPVPEARRVRRVPLVDARDEDVDRRVDRRRWAAAAGRRRGRSRSASRGRGSRPAPARDLDRDVLDRERAGDPTRLEDRRLAAIPGAG